MSGTLRPYQVACLDAIVQARASGLTRLLVQAATGLGKTQIFASLPSRLRPWLETFPLGQRAVLIIAHRDELLDQASTRIRSLHPELLVSIEQGERHANRHSDVIIASIQTLTALKCRRLTRLLSRQTFRIVVYDECHHASSPSARTALVHLGFLPPSDASTEESLEAPSYQDAETMAAALAAWQAVAPKDRLLVGFTATPNRSDGVGLGAVFETIVFSYPLRAAIADGWLTPIVPWVIETDTSLDDVRITAGEFNQKDLGAAVNTEHRNRLAVAAWREHANGLPTLAYTVDVAHAHALAEAFRAEGVQAQAVSGQTPPEQRRQILEDFRQRRIDVVCNCMILTEGTDLPLTECILHAKPTKSATLYEQITGRGLRIHPGKDKCIVLDLVDVARRHSLQQAPVLYGLPPGLVTTGDDLRAVEAELDALSEKYPGMVANQLATGRLTLAQLKAKATTFDVWKVDPVPFTGLVLDWVKIADDTYRLQYPWQQGREMLTVQRDMLGTFELVVTVQPDVTLPHNLRQRTMAASIPECRAALGLAEAFVAQERRTVQRLKATDAPWKLKPASEKQIALLQRRRVPFDPRTLTMGQASSLIDLANARRGR